MSSDTKTEPGGKRCRRRANVNLIYPRIALQSSMARPLSTRPLSQPRINSPRISNRITPVGQSAPSRIRPPCQSSAHDQEPACWAVLAPPRGSAPDPGDDVEQCLHGGFHLFRGDGNGVQQPVIASPGCNRSMPLSVCVLPEWSRLSLWAFITSSTYLRVAKSTTAGSILSSTALVSLTISTMRMVWVQPDPWTAAACGVRALAVAIRVLSIVVKMPAADPPPANVSRNDLLDDQLRLVERVLKQGIDGRASSLPISSDVIAGLGDHWLAAAITNAMWVIFSSTQRDGVGDLACPALVGMAK